MVLYKCELCNKEFNKKYNYTMHINRKKICISDSQIIETIFKLKENNINLVEKIKKLEDENKVLKKMEEGNIILKKDNDILKKDNDILKEENCTMKVQIKEKQELLNYKDITIKDLNMNVKTNKNTKDNNDDIKIKLIQEYVYIIRESDFVQLNKDIYKIGRTSKENPEDRFQKFRKGIEIVAFFKVNNSIECENKMIKCFSNHPNIIKKTEYGKEYFQGDINELINEIVQSLSKTLETT
jgi:hypothetical protein